MKIDNKFPVSFHCQCSTSLAVSCFLIFSCLVLPSAIQAGPTGGNVVGGVGHIHNNGLTTVIHQDSSSLAINWDLFNLNRDEQVQFLQPDASSISLNRILDNNSSLILGRIDANGRVILVNPAGIIFGAGAQINVGSLIASGLDISPGNFMNGDYIFNEVLGTDGTIINKGVLNVTTGGSISLIGKQVYNEGVISARLGRVNMAVGRQAYVSLDKAGFFGVKITDEMLQDELGIDPALFNSGEINAEGGQVLLTARASQDVLSQAVNSGDLARPNHVVLEADGSFSIKKSAKIVNRGRINVSSATVDTEAGHVLIQGENIEHSGEILSNSEATTGRAGAGNITLSARDTVELKGEAIVSARAENTGTGGDIKILGHQVGLLDNSTVDASGANGGGEVLVGGDQQGLNPAIGNAEFLYMGADSRIIADALDIGQGGKIIAFANNTARVYGNLFARGGVNGGNGGFIETSGKQGFEILTAPDISARAGNGTAEGGIWLIDPRNITIQASGNINDFTGDGNPLYTAATDDAELGVDTLLTALGNGSVVVYTGDNTDDNTGGNPAGNISFNAALDYNGIGLGSSLTLRAFNSIDFQDNASISDSVAEGDNLSIALEANNGGDSNAGAGSITFGIGTSVNTNGADFTASGNSFNSGAAAIDVGSGSINLDGLSGAVRLGNLSANDTLSDLLIQGASSITQQAGTIINIGQDLLLGNSSTTEVRLDQLSNTLGTRIIVKADDATLTGTGGIRLDTGNTRFDSGTNIKNTLTVTSTSGGAIDTTSTGSITVDNGNNNATATFNTTGDITFSGSNDFNRVNIQSGATVILNDRTGGIALSANNGAGTGGVTGNLTVSASGGDVTDYGEINIDGTTNLTVDQGQNILLDNAANTLTGIITLNAGGNGTFDSITLSNTAAIDLQSLSLEGDLTLTGDTVNLGRDRLETRAANLTVNTTTANTGAGDVITQTGALNITGNTALAVADGATQNILLDHVSNDFSSIDINTANNATLSDVDSILLNDISVNNLNINAGINYTGSISNNIIVNAATGNSNITVTGTTTLSARNTTLGNANSSNNYNIKLDSGGNNFNDVNIVNGFDVTLSDNAGTINLQSTNQLNSLNVISTAIADNDSTINNIGSAGVTVNDAASFTVADDQSISLTGDNTFILDPLFSAGTNNQINNLSVKDLTDFALQDNFTSQGDLTITANNITLQNTTVGNAINLNATENNNSRISQLNSPDLLVVNATSTLNASTIVLNNAGNDFQGSVIVNNALSNVELVDSADGIQLGVGGANSEFIANNLDVISTGGDITQASAIISTGNVTLDAGASDIVFNTGNNNQFSGNISITDARNARIDNTTGTILNTSSIRNDLEINSGGEIKQTGSASILTVGGNAQLSARDASNADQNITLNNITNQFNTVDIRNAANVDLYDSADAIGIQGNTSGFLTIQSAGRDTANNVIFNTAALSVDGSATFSVEDGESIDLSNSANTFVVDPVFNGAINNLSLSDSTALRFENNLTLSGDLTVNAQGITQVNNSALDIAGPASFNGNAGGINLSGNNDFKNTVNLNTRSGDIQNQPADVVINDRNNLDLGASSIDGGLNVTAQSVTQTENFTQGNAQGIRVANTAQFTIADGGSLELNNIDNQLTSIRIATTTDGAFLDNVTLANRDTLDLQAMNVTNNLNVTSLGGITDSGALVVNGLTQLSGTNITLDNVRNNFNNITIGNGAQVSIENSDTLNFIGTSVISDLLNITVQNGAISSDAGASIQVVNNSILSVTTGEILLDNGQHDFASAQLNASGNAQVSDINGLDIRGSRIGGDLRINAGVQNNTTLNNDIVNTNGVIDVSGTTTLQSVNGANILLARTGSEQALRGAVSITTRGPASATNRLNTVALNNSVATNLQTINTTTLQLTSVGDITDSGAITVSGNATLATGSNIDLSTAANAVSDNNISQLTVVSTPASTANNVSIGNAGALTLNALNITGELKVTANGLTTNGNLLASTGLDLNAGSGALVINSDLSTATGVLSLTADQDITQGAASSLNGPQISLNSTMGSVVQNGRIIQSGAPTPALLAAVDVQAGDRIIMSGAATTQAENDIRYISNNDQGISSLNTTEGAITVESRNGAIIDANGNADNFTARLVNLRALTGIGSQTNSIETRTGELDVINTGINRGIIDIRNTGDVLLTNLKNAGDINFNNDSNVTLDTVVADFTLTDANGNTVNGGNFFFNVERGSVFGVNRGPGVEFLAIPDITGDGASITVSGAFGTFERPIVLKLRSNLLLLSTISGTFFLGGPPTTVTDNSDIQLSISDSLNSVSGQQLIEVESLADIDPAIFTDIRHYDSEEIAIRLPRDQIFEDELDEYDAQSITAQ